MKKCIFACALTAALTACEPECEVQETRCEDSRVEICDADGRWSTVMDCGDVQDAEGLSWVCCPIVLSEEADAGAHACIPADECEEASP